MAKLVEKLLEIQKSIGAVTKSSSNPHFRSKYADLNEVLDVAKEACNKVGVLILQLCGADEKGRYVSTELTDGEGTLQSKVYFSGSEDNMQKIGAAITYARRFGLLSALVLESEDDDGESAVGRGAAGKQTEAKEGPKAPKKAEPNPKDREALNALIRQTGKVLADMKKQPLEETANLVKSYKVSKTEELTDAQAKEVYAKLKSKLEEK